MVMNNINPGLVSMCKERVKKTRIGEIRPSFLSSPISSHFLPSHDSVQWEKGLKMSLPAVLQRNTGCG